LRSWGYRHTPLCLLIKVCAHEKGEEVPESIGDGRNEIETPQEFNCPKATLYNFSGNF
jgi:hypothetical protein